jgi:hypothetical protein
MLDITQKITLDEGFAHVTAEGTFSLEHAKNKYVEMLEAIAPLKIEKVLYDGRKIIGNPRVMERFYYGEFAADKVRQYITKGIPSTIKLAYVLREPVLDSERFGETVAVNRGLNCKVFKQVGAARIWLGASKARA